MSPTRVSPKRGSRKRVRPESGTSVARACIAVMGGAGAMGRITVRDLVETAPPEVAIVLADRDRAAADAVIRALPARRRRRVRFVAVDAADVEATSRALAGTTVLINACHHTFNLRVMRVALACGSHYCDLGGLFHVTRQQLRLHRRFARAGLLALCGIGSAPGIVNIMARAAAEPLDEVSEIHIAVGTVDLASASASASESESGAESMATPALATSYSLDTILDEASSPAALFTEGALQFVEPLSGASAVDFPAPVGRQYPARTLHSELATLPESFRDRGIREVSFRIAFAGDLMERLRFLHRLGLTSHTPIAVRAGGGRARVAPRDLLLALVAQQAQAQANGSVGVAAPASRPATSLTPNPAPQEYEVLRVIVRGRQASARVEIVSDCHVSGIPEWRLGVDVDTGCPPSIVAQMLVRGEMDARGVLPPERAVPPAPFLQALAARGMRIARRRRRLT